MLIKRIISASIISIILISNTYTVFGDDIIPENIVTEASIEQTITSVPDINTQLDTLYTEIANNLSIDKSFVKQLHLLAGGKSVYADKKPNIYNELTIETMDAPMNIIGASTEYRKAEFIQCPD
ncbi:MAG: hypothetical protein J6A59_15030, partial [Lachnospiraceae bacterium]|nr:hypothetical protein [Lachnospiraceae bacterium]